MTQVLHSFRHYNRFYRDDMGGWEGTVGYTLGGYTLYFNTMPASAPFVGVALCSPKDQYNRKLGRTLAMNRMMELYGKYPQKEVIDGVFGVINIPSVTAPTDTERGKIYNAAMLHALQVLTEYYDLAEIRIVDLGPWQQKGETDE